jgi:hypothetical protein
MFRPRKESPKSHQANRMAAARMNPLEQACTTCCLVLPSMILLRISLE